MAIKRPDIYEHNNPNLPIVDSDFVKGGIRSAVQNVSDLYSLTGKTEQLKQHSTQVYVSGQDAFYLLKDINNIGNTNGWLKMTGVGGDGGTVSISNVVYTTGDQSITGEKTFQQNINSPGMLNIGGEIELNENKLFNYILLMSGRNSPVESEPESYTLMQLKYAGNNSWRDNDSEEHALIKKENNGSWSFRYYAYGNIVDNVADGTSSKYPWQSQWQHNGGFTFDGDDTITGSLLKQTSLDWKNKILSGQWNTDQRLLVNGTGVLLSGEVVGSLSNVVYTTGNQTIDGLKTFSTRPEINGSGVLLQGEAAAGSVSNVVFTTGDQTISGAKIFSTGGGAYLKSESIYTNNASALKLSDNPGNTALLPLNTLYLNSVSPFETTQSNVNTTGIKIYFNFTNDNQQELSRHIRTQSIIFQTGFNPSVGPWITVAENVQNSTGIIISGNTNISPRPLFINYSLEDRLKHIETNGVFSLLSGEKMGVGIHNPSEKLHVVGNLKLDGRLITNTRPTINGTGVLLSGEAAQVDLSSTVRTTGNQTISGTKTFVTNSLLYSGVNVNFDKNTNVTFSGTPVFTSGINSNVLFDSRTSNFNFDSFMNSKMIFVSGNSNITGTLPLNLANGYNVSITQMGTGKVVFTGVNGVSIRQRLGLYSTAGRYAVASLLHMNNNEYILYGDLA